MLNFVSKRYATVIFIFELHFVMKFQSNTQSQIIRKSRLQSTDCSHFESHPVTLLIESSLQNATQKSSLQSTERLENKRKNIKNVDSKYWMLVRKTFQNYFLKRSDDCNIIFARPRPSPVSHDFPVRPRPHPSPADHDFCRPTAPTPASHVHLLRSESES